MLKRLMTFMPTLFKAVVGAFALAAVVFALVFAGYLAGIRSCESLSKEDAQKSLAVVQKATREANAYRAEKDKEINDLKQQLKEVDHACLDQTLPSDLLDILNH